MSFYSTKIRKYWFPFIILAIIVLAVGWIVAGVIYPSNVQGNDQFLPTPIPPTATEAPTATPTSSPTAVFTSTQSANTATATPTYNCTYSMYYWRTNSGAWEIEYLLLSNLSYSKIKAIEIMAIEDPTPTERLMGQFFAALLNTLKGAESSEIDPVIIKARDWLILRPHGIDLTQSEILEIESFTGQLQAYNSGLIGPGLCSDEPATPTPAATATPEPTATFTPGPDLPFFTPTATKSSGGGKPRPTNTPAPPPQATNTPQPQLPTPTIKPPPTLPPPTSVPSTPEP